jgi:AcrR family transcriptional regulator
MRSETLKMATPVRRKKKAEPASAAADQKLSGAAVDEARNEPPKAAAPVRRSRKADQKSRPSAERKPSRAGMETRTRLLDTAERVFAELGYEGASLRVIADHANLHGALSTYYFGTKERLFEEVIARRAVDLEQQRLASLIKIDLSAQSREATVRLLIEAYISPMVEARFGFSVQKKAYVQIMANLINDPRWVPVIQRHFDYCSKKYIEAWRVVFPHAHQGSLLNAFSFMVATMLYVCSFTDRFGQYRGTRTKIDQVREALTADLIRFVQAGFMAL